jgi:lipopolysaccharide/colanic/teichoic acid biosynthesis glycosyltransferase
MYQLLKRGVDILFSLTLLLMLAPLFLVIILLLSLTGEKEVFYLQERMGYRNRKFKIWKFATMLKDSPKMGTGDVTLRNDPRLLPLGAFLRKTKLNELPQLINVLKGDMTLVGPRPLMLKGFDRYCPEVQRKIYRVKPGITGIGSVIFRDEEAIVSRSMNYEETYQKINNFKGDLELWYQKNLNLSTDISILFLTVWVLVYPKSDLVYKIFGGLPELHEEYLIQTSSAIA